MHIVYHHRFTRVYAGDPAAAPGRIEAVLRALKAHDGHTFVRPSAATDAQVALAHSETHIATIKRQGLFDIATLSAGAAIEAALLGMERPSFALCRPPGHHASEASAWGFCWLNNMAIALLTLASLGLVSTALVLDIDLHYGDGTVNILGPYPGFTVCNPDCSSKGAWFGVLEDFLECPAVDVVAVSAGFDAHEDDWGGLLATDDYRRVGALARAKAERDGAGLFAVLEGGYNHDSLSDAVVGFVEGLEGG